MRLLAILASVTVVHAVSYTATLTTGGHHPVVDSRWPYAVRVVDGKGEPLRARISVAIVDPLGTAHATEYYASTKPVVNIPFRGTFRDAVKWPPESRGYPLTFRVTLKVGTTSRVLRYSVVSR
jgi:hypothetical protein